MTAGFSLDDIVTKTEIDSHKTPKKTLKKHAKNPKKIIKKLSVLR
jgi:hypothetical protein